MTSFSIVIPAFNEEDGIADIVQRVLSVRPDLCKVGVEDMELLVVDDGSKDRTAEITRSIEGVRLIQHPRNRGYGAALKTGFSNSRGELIGFLDADGTYPPEHFPQLCQAALQGNDLVIGSRMAGADSEMPLTRRVGNFFFANLLSVLGRQKVTDSASGMRVFRRQVMDLVYPLPDGLNLTPVMSARAVHENIRMVEVPIPYSERLGRSKLSVVKDGWRFLSSMVWTVLNYNPVRIFGMIGILGTVVAGLVSLGIVVARLSGVTSLGPWGVAALFWGLVSGVVGVSLFALGATFNYIVSLFYRRPIRQGLFGKPVFKRPLEHYFGRVGALTLAVGSIIALTALALGLRGWEISRLWLYLTSSAMMIVVGVQLMIYRLLMNVLLDLSQRDAAAQADRQGN
jgi:glycosyltransferase involved in cell wall biosynthesis